MYAVPDRLRRLLLETVDGVVSLLYPALCFSCGAPVRDGSRICAVCESWVTRLLPPFCPCCSRPYADDGTLRPGRCVNCANRALHFSCAVAGYRSQGVVREFIHRFKYQAQLHIGSQLGEWLLEGLRDPRLVAPRPDLLIPVPLHPSREQDRGYNQARLLAEFVSARTGLPIAEPLRRIRATSTQTALTRHERLHNLAGAFALRQRADVRALHALLIDDVLTTGSTVNECARILTRAGAASVRALVVARA